MKECYKVFKIIKRCLTEAPVLQYYNLRMETRVETDALDSIVAAIIL